MANCPPRSAWARGVPPAWRFVAAVSVLVLSVVAGAWGSDASARPGKRERPGKPKRQSIVLDGLDERVNWNDGDSFRILGGPREGQKARLVGYNTLESYGPVHFWGDANGWDLYRTHKDATELAKSEPWECQSQGDVDGYGRILVLCPELRRRLISAGLAHVYAYGKEAADPELLELQMDAQNRRVGMWRFGIPRGIVTSVHSIDEPRDEDEGGGDAEPRRKKSYNRIADTRTGKTWTVEHAAVFKPCDVFCHAGSCMLYIPFDVRYGDRRPRCVTGDEGEKNRMGGPSHLVTPDVGDRR
jgi:micrococcal nuclease